MAEHSEVFTQIQRKMHGLDGEEVWSSVSCIFILGLIRCKKVNILMSCIYKLMISLKPWA